MQQIQVDIGPDGGIRIEAREFTGPECEKATAFLEQALGVVSRRTRKPEFHAGRAQRRSQGTGTGGGRHGG